MIKLTAIGNLGKDAIKNEVNGKSVINFSLAHTEKFTNNNGEQKEKTIWIEASYWTDKTGILPYLVKGQQIYVEGQPEIRTWEKDGKSGASLTLRVNTIQLLGKVQEGVKETQRQPSTAQPVTVDEDDSGLPF